MAAQGFLLSFLLFSLAVTCYGTTLADIDQSLLVTTSTTPGQVIKAGDDNITVTWSFDKTFTTSKESTYKTVEVKLCYAPISQKDRAWRKTVAELKKDKTCQHTLTKGPYTSSVSTFTGVVERDVPGATYFLRAYAYDTNEHEVAYGQTTDPLKTTNLFVLEAVTGRHATLDIASVCFSVFAVVSLFGFFYLEKRKAKASAQN